MSVFTACKIELTIAGPIMSGGTGPVAWGLDKVFNRDHRGNYCIERTHIKGKLRESVVELEGIRGRVAGVSVNRLFGPKDGDGSILKFTDFKLDGVVSGPSDRAITRIQIDPDRKVVNTSFIAAVQDLFPEGTETKWTGEIAYYAADEATAKKIAERLKLGLSWMTAVGSDKVVGFGRVTKVKLTATYPEINISSDAADMPADTGHVSFAIRTTDRLLIVEGRKNANYVDSEKIITGRMIKGAVAYTMNVLVGSSNWFAPIDSSNMATAKEFAKLTEHFENIRFTHAFPVLACASIRPTIVPYSAAAVPTETGSNKRQLKDFALNDEATVVHDKAPLFQIDWKGSDREKANDQFGWAEPRRLVKTRTAIDSESRRAEEKKLFTYEYICPETSDGCQIEWLSDVTLGSVPQEDRGAVTAQLSTVFKHLKWLGKGDSWVEIAPAPEAKPAMPGTAELREGWAIVTLQSDAVMLNPKAVLDNSDLHMLYGAYWHEISVGALEMTDFFAHQKTVGGYAAEQLARNKKPPYYPFYLTGAGSVFKLKSTNGDANGVLKAWHDNGLNMPNWAKETYGEEGDPLWKNCPYVPENGYGEVAINLDWHWEAKHHG